MSSLQSKIGYLVASLSHQLKKEIEESLKHLNLPVEQVRVLEALSGRDAREGLSMSDLSRLVFVDASTLTKLVDRMISDSLVYRVSDPNDRRRVKVLVTPKGMELFKQLKPVLEEQEAGLIDSIAAVTDTPKEGIVSLLEHLCNRDAPPAVKAKPVKSARKTSAGDSLKAGR